MTFRTRTHSLAVLAVLALGAALPAAAQATTVSRLIGEQGPLVEILDSAGVADNLIATGTSMGGVTVTSSTGAITAGQGCVQTGTNSVSCLGGIGLLTAGLGGGDDVFVDRTNVEAIQNGGAGKDTLTAGTGDSLILGGPDSDTLSNGENAGFDGIARTVDIRGEGGADSIDLSANRSGPDTASGDTQGQQQFVDTVTYERRAESGASVIVKLDNNANDGFSGARFEEKDNVQQSVENVVGTGGPDSITASGDVNQLRGAAGDDILSGGSGNDLLIGGPGNDTELGGPGADRLGSTSAENAAQDDPGIDKFGGGDGIDQLFTADGVRDRIKLVTGDFGGIDCGPPTPVEFPGDVAAIDLKDTGLPVACEAVQEGAKDQHPLVQVGGGKVRVRRGRAHLRVTCPRKTPGRRCKGRIDIVERGKKLASGRYRLRKGRKRTFKLPLRSRARGRAVVQTHERDTKGRPETTSTRITLG